MYNYILNLKKTKNKKFKHITNNYNYIFFCKSNNLKSEDIIKFKKTNLKFYHIKSNFSINNINLKGQGPLMLIYFNDFKNISLLYNLKKFDILFILNKNIQTSILKLDKILNKPFLLIQLNQPLFILYNQLLYINK